MSSSQKIQNDFDDYCHPGEIYAGEAHRAPEPLEIKPSKKNNKIVSNNKNIRIAAAAIVNHVANGGWLCASWADYAVPGGISKRLKKRGHLGAAMRSALVVAERQKIDLMAMASKNLDNAKAWAGGVTVVVDVSAGGFCLTDLV